MTSTAVNQSLYNFSEEEQMIKETGSFNSIIINEINVNSFWIVARFGKEHVEPYVHEMEEAGAIKPELLKALFDQGVSDSFRPGR
jgi:hypothetical protein